MPAFAAVSLHVPDKCLLRMQPAGHVTGKVSTAAHRVLYCQNDPQDGMHGHGMQAHACGCSSARPRSPRSPFTMDQQDQPAWCSKPSISCRYITLAATGWAECNVANNLCLRAAGTHPPSMRAAFWRPSDWEAYCAQWRDLEVNQQTEVSCLQGVLVLACFTMSAEQNKARICIS